MNLQDIILANKITRFLKLYSFCKMISEEENWDAKQDWLDFTIQ